MCGHWLTQLENLQQIPKISLFGQRKNLFFLKTIKFSSKNIFSHNINFSSLTSHFSSTLLPTTLPTFRHSHFGFLYRVKGQEGTSLGQRRQDWLGGKVRRLKWMWWTIDWTIPGAHLVQEVP